MYIHYLCIGQIVKPGFELIRKIWVWCIAKHYFDTIIHADELMSCIYVFHGAIKSFIDIGNYINVQFFSPLYTT